MATYQIINLQTGEFHAVSLEETADIAQLDPNEIAWAIEEHGVCETEIHQITKLPEPPEMAEGDASDAGDGDIESGTSAADDHKEPLPVFVYISQEEFEAHLAESPAAVIRLGWDEPIVREAVEADLRRVATMLRGDEGEGGGEVREPSAVYHLTREAIALVR
jgi:hypothetical protein